MKYFSALKKVYHNCWFNEYDYSMVEYHYNEYVYELVRGVTKLRKEDRYGSKRITGKS